MEVLKVIKFTKDDSQTLNELQKLCFMAASFFQDDRIASQEGSGIRAITRIRAGGTLEKKHLAEASMEIRKALDRLDETEPHPFFPAELKKQYADNLLVALGMTESWENLLS